MDSTSSRWRRWRKFPAKVVKHVMKSHRVQIPKYEMPLRLRPWFVVMTCFIMVLLAFLGFTNYSRALPLNDKVLHFMCFCLATGVFYFIIDVEESARRIWFWRHSAMMFTVFTCLFCGGVLSEFVQAALPYKIFDWGDIIANLLGSSLGLYVAYNLERYYRHRREIARLYQPLSASPSEYPEIFDDDDELDRTQLLPTHVNSKGGTKPTLPRIENVWDTREDVFGVGSDSEDEGPSGTAPVNRPGPETPRIVISHPSDT